MAEGSDKCGKRMPYFLQLLVNLHTCTRARIDAHPHREEEREPDRHAGRQTNRQTKKEREQRERVFGQWLVA